MSIRCIALSVLFFLSYFSVSAQFTDDFSDGNFTANPTWTGNTSSFIVNTNLALQTNNNMVNSNYFLSTQNTLAKNTEWDFYVAIDFNPSSKNYIDIYLTASSSDLLATNNSGYFVRIGNTEDQVALYMKNVDGSSLKLIDGAHGILNHSKNAINIKVKRDDNFQWSLYRQLVGTDPTFVSEGVITESSFHTSQYFGIVVKQSTASFFGKHYFDNFSVQPLPDNNHPNVIGITATSHNDLQIEFDKNLDPQSASDTNNYFLELPTVHPSKAQLHATNNKIVLLHFEKPFAENLSMKLMTTNIKDQNGNILVSGSFAFSYDHSEPYEIVIDEIMADPVPPVALPEAEWIEIKNTSVYPINLEGWKILKNNKYTDPFPNYLLQPDRFVVICKPTFENVLTPFTKLISVPNFPTLANNSDVLSLISKDRKIIHAVSYSSKWYQNPVKEKGGWTLEMIDTKNPCQGINNWKASIHPSGGTPGRKNSVDGINPDPDPPVAWRAFTTDFQTVNIVFDKPLDSSSACNLHNYSLSDELKIDSCIVAGPFFNAIKLKIHGILDAHKIYEATINGVSGCNGIAVKNNLVRFGIPDKCDSSDLVINEILYKPAPQSESYVEIYNRSQKIIDLKNIYLAKRNDINQVSEIYNLSKGNYQLFPADYLVVTKDSAKIISQYYTVNKKAFIEIPNFPALGRDSGKVLLLNESGQNIDEVDYFDKWQFQLLTKTEGVSLERIDFNHPATEDNFHSASSSAGYGTPTAMNSEYLNDKIHNNEFNISPDIISPDNDGVDDYATINYSFRNPGLLCTINIFDIDGRLVKSLVKNAICGTSGSFRWDGLSEGNQALKMGIYVVVGDTLDPANGSAKHFKKAIVLARK